MFLKHISRKCWIILLFLLLTLPVHATDTRVNHRIIKPSKIIKGNDSLITGSCFLRITTLHEWFWVWLQHKPSVYETNQSKKHRPTWQFELEKLSFSDIPRVDFEKHMVIAILTGEQSNVSDLNATIVETEDEIKCNYSITENSEINKSQAKNYYVFFILPQIDKPLIFIEQHLDQSIRERKRLGKLKYDTKPKSPYSPKELVLKEFLLKNELKLSLFIEIERKKNSHSQDNDYDNNIYFIDMDREEDPSDEFMERFSGFGPIIKKYSESTGYPKAPGFVRDKKTKQSGVILYARILKWIDENNAEVEYGYYKHGLGAQKTIQLVEYKDGNWILGERIGGYIS